MPSVVTINRPDVVAMVERVANQLTCGNKTEAVALAMRRLLEQENRTGSLFAAHPGSVSIREGVDLTAPVIPDSEAESGQGTH